ncbi:hypothetical protein [Candidatus Rariloculus sp.]|uniref:hypothetical protein n=1 Tax=Candidatus Rariloculus sp. TaxID=3101265 RepID=UPI003D0E8657
MNRALDRGAVLRGLARSLCAVLPLLAPHSAMAQADVEALADFRACGAVDRDSARLACFDGVLSADREGGGIGEIVEAEPVSETVAPDVPLAAAEPAETRIASTPRVEPAEAPAASAPRTQAVETPPASASPAAPAETQIASAPREEAVETPAASVSRSEPAQAQPANEPRAETARPRAASTTRSEPAEAPTLTIVELRTGIPGSARFVADDGRVFVQTSGASNYRSFPEVPFEATLEDGALGSRFLRLGPRLRVRVSSAD